ncbi:MAG: phytanoyl-CoA dioxygenase family protein [Gammaproteobacteria bacterium]|nr:phytanoyl-CoA dioxygenase family protein [Gammaproteobacteria bacterium]
MDIPALDSVPDADAIRLEARRLGLERHLLEMHTYGVTIVPPELLGSPDLIERLREAILRVLAERHDLEVPEDWRTYSDNWGGRKKTWCWLLEDEAFIEAALHPVALCIARFMCGRNVVLQGTPAIVKTRDGGEYRRDTGGYMRLHTDTHGVPSPLPEWAQLINLSWLLTDYLSREDGPTVLVPGSQRGRMPRGEESQAHLTEHDYIKPVPLEGAAGSLAVWNGSMWHGSVRRTKPGARITLVHVYQRVFMRPIERVKEISPEYLERWPGLPKMLGYERIYPYREEVDRPHHVDPTIQAGRDQYA